MAGKKSFSDFYIHLTLDYLSFKLYMKINLKSYKILFNGFSWPIEYFNRKKSGGYGGKISYLESMDKTQGVRITHKSHLTTSLNNI